MCGIFGFSRTENLAPESVVAEMLQALHHRGPDDSGDYIDSSFCLGSVLLSIVDVGRGHQPRFLDWGGEKYACVFNGEMYNFLSIRSELEHLGISFSTECDTEVALAAYACWGPEALDRFDGQWALAIWEVNRKRLFLARDPFGIKPLFYWHRGDVLAFASEPKALFKHPKISCEPNMVTIAEFFTHGFAFAAGYSTGSRSFYKGVSSLEQGHYLYWEPGSRPCVKRYYELPFDTEYPLGKRSDMVCEIRKRVQESTISCLMGDEEVGVALSGGLDSSIVAAIAARELKGLGKDPLIASCITYDGQSSNEDKEHAQRLVDHLGVDAPIHLVFSHMNLDNYLDDLDGLLRHFDEPHWEIKQLAMFNNYRKLKAMGVKVVLSGEGADEVFLGYYHKFPGFLHPVIESSKTLRDLWSRRFSVVNNIIIGDISDILDGLLARRLASTTSHLVIAGLIQRVGCNAGTFTHFCTGCSWITTVVAWPIPWREDSPI